MHLFFVCVYVFLIMTVLSEVDALMDAVFECVFCSCYTAALRVLSRGYAAAVTMLLFVCVYVCLSALNPCKCGSVVCVWVWVSDSVR